MGRALYLPDSRDDLFDIWCHVLEESESLEVADRVVDAIDDTCQIYASQPEMGQLRPDLAPLVRCFPVGKYVVFYMLLDDGIECPLF